MSQVVLQSGGRMRVLLLAWGALLVVLLGGSAALAWAQPSGGVESTGAVQGADLEAEAEFKAPGSASANSVVAAPGETSDAAPSGVQQGSVDGSIPSAGFVVAESDPGGTITSYSLFPLFDASGSWASSESRLRTVNAIVGLEPSYEDPQESPQSEYAAREFLGSCDPAEMTSALVQSFVDSSGQVKAHVRETVSVKPGSYLAVPDNGSGSALFEVAEGATEHLYAKNALPSLDKRVSRDGASFGSSVTAGQGDRLTYRLIVGLPPDLTDRSPYRLTVVDTPCEGVDVDASTVSVSADGELIGSDEYEVSWNEDARTLTIRFDDVSARGSAFGAQLLVEYQAGLNDRAVMGGEGNRNAARVITDYGEVPSSPATVYTFGIAVGKSAADSGLPLQGATFQLLGENGDVRAEGVTDRDGSVSFDRVDAGTYTLRESGAPRGYRMIEDIPIMIEAADENDVLVLEAQVGSGGEASIDAERGRVAVAVQDDPEPALFAAPQTGDRLYLTALALAAFASAAVALAVMWRERLRRARAAGQRADEGREVNR